MMIKIPISVTDNGRHGVFRGRIMLTEEYRDWKNAAILVVKSQLPKGYKALALSIENQLVYRVKIFTKDKRTDQVNYIKGINDVLTQAGIWNDDKYVCPQFEWREIDIKNPRAEITL